MELLERTIIALKGKSYDQLVSAIHAACIVIHHQAAKDYRSPGRRMEHVQLVENMMTVGMGRVIAARRMFPNGRFCRQWYTMNHFTNTKANEVYAIWRGTLNKWGYSVIPPTYYADLTAWILDTCEELRSREHTAVAENLLRIGYCELELQLGVKLEDF